MSIRPPAAPYEFFEHTADIGIRAKAKTLSALFTAMAQGLVELIAEQSIIPAVEARPITLSARGADALLLAWLQEVLYWFSTDRFLPTAYDFSEVTPLHLRGQVRGGQFHPRRHIQGREVKAITRHQLRVEQTAEGWRGQVIVDV